MFCAAAALCPAPRSTTASSKAERPFAEIESFLAQPPRPTFRSSPGSPVLAAVVAFGATAFVTLRRRSRLRNSHQPDSSTRSRRPPARRLAVAATTPKAASIACFCLFDSSALFPGAGAWKVSNRRRGMREISLTWGVFSQAACGIGTYADGVIVCLAERGRERNAQSRMRLFGRTEAP
jgi:hypothetical protein